MKVFGCGRGLGTKADKSEISFLGKVELHNLLIYRMREVLDNFIVYNYIQDYGLECSGGVERSKLGPGLTPFGLNPIRAN